ncbi:hypothetical protein D3C76_1320420 [compost metagenome]
MKEAGVVASVRFAKKLTERGVDVLGAFEIAEGSVGLDAAVFSDPQEDDSIYRSLDGGIELSNAERLVSQEDIFGQGFSP